MLNTEYQSGATTFYIKKLFAMEQYRLLETIRPAWADAVKSVDLSDIKLNASDKSVAAAQKVLAGDETDVSDALEEEAGMNLVQTGIKLAATALSVDGSVVEQIRQQLFKNIRYSTPENQTRLVLLGEEDTAFEGQSGIAVYRLLFEAVKINFLDTSEGKTWDLEAISNIFRR